MSGLRWAWELFLAILMPKRARVRELRWAAAQIETLWYEDRYGQRLTWDWGDCPDIPPGAHYQHSRFPTELAHLTLDVSDGRSREVCRGTSGWPDDLVTAMVRAGLTASEAIKIAGTSCGRCLNTLSFEFLRGSGYPASSREWRECRTRCEHCEPREGVELMVLG